MILDGKCGAFNPLLLECLSENSDKIQNAISEKSEEVAMRREVRSYADAVMHAKNGGVSERTLKLLDYERMKNTFYATMSEEIQFEYSAPADMLKISPWGANKMEISENIIAPGSNEALHKLLGESWWEMLMRRVGESSAEKPEFTVEHRLMCRGELRWHKIIIHAIWSDTIPPQLDGFIGKAVDIHDTHTQFVELKEKTLRDPLTGLFNRTGAREQIERRILSYPEHKYALACFDVDFFKNANDVYGHLFGDKVLLHVAQKMTHSVRASDICARTGGDEFLIFLEYDTDIKPIVERIFRSLCGDVSGFNLSVSMGIAEMTRKGESYEEIFHRADQALYCSKRNGRAQYHIYDDSMKDILGDGEENDEKNKSDKKEGR